MTAPSYNELQAIYMARNLYLPKNINEYTPQEENDIYQRFAIGYNQLKEEPEINDLVLLISNYR
jgi:hypothetical protein